MSVSSIPEKVKIRLWGKAAGRCQYEGCNKPLWYDSLTKAEFNTAYIAHIIADKPDGPRGHNTLSERLKADISNLMLMCDEHHRLIDREDVDGHPVDRLQGMKSRHEARMEQITSLIENKRSHVILYGANIGQQSASISFSSASQAMLPNWYPAERQALELSLVHSSFRDDEPDYWKIETENLRRLFDQRIRPVTSNHEVTHYSVFALAPQPLLVLLGSLITDIPAAEIYQLHREPPGWKWQNHPEGFEYIINSPDAIYPTVALNLSLSATINDSRIHSILGDDVSIWTITIENPNNDNLKSRQQLSTFRKELRGLFDKIKAAHGEDNIIHVFPAVPVSVAIDVGRVWMPKADLPMKIYDQNRRNGGFIPALDIAI